MYVGKKKWRIYFIYGGRTTLLHIKTESFGVHIIFSSLKLQMNNGFFGKYD